MEEKLLAALTALFKGHGIPTERDGARLRAGDLAIEPRIFQRGNANDTEQVQVDFAIDSPRLAGVPFLDSIAGVGATQDLAVSNAIGKFTQGSFHVIAAALADHADTAEPVEIERWENGRGAAWRVFVGPLFLQATQHGARVAGCEQFFPALEQRFAESMDAGPHWMRVFLGALDGKVMGREVLVDGQHWPAGQALLDAHPFGHPAGYASFRNLIIALPDGDRR
jgi:hypothetical protein